MLNISFQLNGQKKQIRVSPDISLLKLLREDFGLTGAKAGCNKGHCGTCAVLVNGKVVMSCHYPVNKADGAEIVTIEGIGTPENPHPIQQAFVQAGAVQCGFCTPGMIIRAKALLDSNLYPTREEIVKAFNPHLCRCTGYAKIFLAVDLAARLLKGETDQLPGYAQNDGKVIGKRIPRQDALAKAAGTEKFAADLHIADLHPANMHATDVPKVKMLHLKVLRSPHAHARIVTVDATSAKTIPGVVDVLTAADVPGTNRLKISRADQPVLCADKVRYIGDPVAAVVAVSEVIAEQALASIEVKYEPLTAINHTGQALQDQAPQIHEDHPNLLAVQTVLHGDIIAGFERAEIIVEREYSTQLIEHAYLEPDAGIAYLSGQGQVVIHAGSQNIHYDRKALAEALGLNQEKVRVIQSPTGGAFGGKLDVSVQGILGLAAFKHKQPVKLVYTREETFQCTTKRHAFQIRCRLGAEKSGKLLALEMDIVTATGAYASFGKSVMYRAVIHATGPYRIPHVRINGSVVYTNGPVGGAMRGFGAPQVTFALESQLDILAEQLGIDPLELRAMNCFTQGDTTATGQNLDHEIGMLKCLDRIREYYPPAIEQARVFNSQSSEIKRGVGLAGMWFGPGKSKPDESEAHAALQADGTLQVWIGAADMGQGSDTVFAQIAAQELGIAFEAVQVTSTDTMLTPDGGYSSGSRQTHISGSAVRSAVAALREALLEAAGKLLGEHSSQMECTQGMVFSRLDNTKHISLAELAQVGVSQRYAGRKAAEITALDPETGEGIPYETYCFGIQMAEVEVNIKTGEVKVLRVVAAHDSGTPINPMYMEGQIEGGIVMGMGYALSEEFVPEQTVNFARYRIPRAKDVPKILPLLVEVPRGGGPYGATGVAEGALVPTAPAIINAIYNACGARIYNLPANKNKLKAELAPIWNKK